MIDPRDTELIDEAVQRRDLSVKVKNQDLAIEYYVDEENDRLYGLVRFYFPDNILVETDGGTYGTFVGLRFYER